MSLPGGVQRIARSFAVGSIEGCLYRVINGEPCHESLGRFEETRGLKTRNNVATCIQAGCLQTLWKPDVSEEYSGGEEPAAYPDAVAQANMTCFFHRVGNSISASEFKRRPPRSKCASKKPTRFQAALRHSSRATPSFELSSSPCRLRRGARHGKWMYGCIQC